MVVACFCVCTYVRMYIRVDIVSSWAAETVLQIKNRETWTLVSKRPLQVRDIVLVRSIGKLYS